MARLTIEDQWWTDPRRERLAELVGSMLLADAWAIRLWRLAQEHWGRGRRLIPQAVFESIEAAPKLIQAGLATVESEGVHVKGAEDFIGWLNDKRAAGKVGGQKSAESRIKTYGTAQPDPPKRPKQKRSKVEALPEAETKHIEPSGFGSGSDSGSLKIPKTSSSGAAASLPAVVDGGQPEKRGKNGVSIWMEAYHRRYGCRYPALGKDHGTLVNLEKTYTGEQLETLFACYLAIKEPLYESQKHPLSLFFRDLPKISVAAQTGIDPSVGEEPDWKKEARRKEAEGRQANGT